MFKALLQSLFIIFLIIFFSSKTFSQITVSGLVVDSATNQPLPGIDVLIKSEIVQSNGYGFFSLKSKDNICNLYFVKDGYNTRLINFELNKDTFLTIRLSQRILTEIIITDTLTTHSVSGNHATTITKQALDRMPVLLGEKDIVRALQILPGVITSGEAGSSINVEGGGIDQNLFILDDITVYNVNHLLGFVSTFNPEIISEATVYKGYFPARYGGKLSSVIDVKSREGDRTKFRGGFAISPTSAKLTLEGPFKKNKSSFLLSARRTFLDPLAKVAFEDFSDYANFYFHDVNFKTNLTANASNRFFLSVFTSSDKFSDESGGNNKLTWSNYGASVRWNHIWNAKLFSNITIVGNKYLFESSQFSDNDKFVYQSLIKNYTVKTDMDYFINNTSGIKAGGGVNLFELQPGVFSETLQGVAIEKNYHYKPFNYFVYAESYFPVFKNLIANAGVHFTAFNNDKLYTSFEPRVTLDYNFKNSDVLSLAYSQTSQFLHLLSNTGLGLPTDLWVPSTAGFKPELARNLSLSHHHNFSKNAWSINSSVYYRRLYNIMAYRPGTRFLTISQDYDKIYIPDWSKNAIQGKGEAYGLEIMLEKKSGKLTAIVSYTLSYAKRQFEEINFNKPYFASFDRRHVGSLLVTYALRENQLKRRHVEISVAFNYASPNPVELPLGSVPYIPFSSTTNSYPYNVGTLTAYPDYGKLRIRSNHHCDVALRIIKEKKRKRILEFGVYNIYNRANPFYYYLSSEDRSFSFTGPPVTSQSIKYKSYFRILPYIAYSINFK